MRRHAATVIIVFLSVACRNQEHASHDITATNRTASTTAPAATAPYDLQFLDTMSHHHQMAVEMVNAAHGRFAHEELAQAGSEIVADQKQEIAQMKTWRDQWYAGASDAVNMNMPGMASGMNMDASHLKNMSGNELDLMFIDMMIPHHQGAIDMAEDALTKAEHPEIKELAKNIIDAQGREIAQFNAWRQAWATSK